MKHTLKELQGIMNKYHLCTFYVLPLVGLSNTSFGEDNFVNCYVSEDLSMVLVKVRNTLVIPLEPRHLADTVQVKDEEYLAYAIPEMWKKDLDFFSAGLYSKMSSAAKELIRTYSGLTTDSTKETGNVDYRILALDKSPILREYLQENLSMIIPPESELLDPPKKDQFINVQTKPLSFG